MLGQPRRRWANIGEIVARCVVFAGIILSAFVGAGLVSLSDIVGWLTFYPFEFKFIRGEGVLVTKFNLHAQQTGLKENIHLFV